MKLHLIIQQQINSDTVVPYLELSNVNVYVLEAVMWKI